ncbi:hypothetical protein GW796_06490 [archaeon]|nr:hypothetical protein [archaeon]
MKKIIIILLSLNLIIVGYVFYKKNVSNSVDITTLSETNFKNILREPIQEDLVSEDLKEFKNDIFKITPIKKYKIVARILRKEKYYIGDDTKILPIDLVLGWNKMSNLEIIKSNNIKISQSNRFYFWRVSNFNNISRYDIENNSANVHIMPLNEKIKDLIEDLSEEDLVYFEGYLVNIENIKKGSRLLSSTSRSDTGAGACEILLVKNLKLIL